MVNDGYVPQRGDLVWVSFSPTKGHEQKGKRPALVISPSSYNKKSSLAIMCPVTSQEKGYPFEIPLEVEKVEGVVLADQVRTLDWTAREVSFIEKVSEKVINETRNKINLLI